MKTYTINFTDFIGNSWVMNWEPTTSKQKNLTETDIAAIAHFLSTRNWPKHTTAAARNCYQMLAAQIANTIIEDISRSSKLSKKFNEKLSDLYCNKVLSKEGAALYEQCILIAHGDPTPDNVNNLYNRLKKLVKLENLFTVELEECDTGDVKNDDATGLTLANNKHMKCCLCGSDIDNDHMGHNPYPVRPQSWYGDKKNRCCTACNQHIVIPIRMRSYKNQNIDYHRTMMKMDYEQLLDFVA